MISFEPFWDMLKTRGITIYDLEYKYNFNPAEISRMKHNHNFNLKYVNHLCETFDCSLNDVICYRAE